MGHSFPKWWTILHQQLFQGLFACLFDRNEPLSDPGILRRYPALQTQQGCLLHFELLSCPVQAVQDILYLVSHCRRKVLFRY